MITPMTLSTRTRGNLRLLLSLALLSLALLPQAVGKAQPTAGAITRGIYLLSNQQLIALAEALPAYPAAPLAISGVQAGESLVGLDLRPQNGQLYALGVNAAANTASLYAISPHTGTAAVVGTAGQIAYVDAVGAPVDLPEDGYGFDFNPQADRIRVVTSSGLNLRINPNTGAPVDGNLGAGSFAGTNPDGTITPTTGADATAYTNSTYDTTVTTQYTLDSVTNALYIQNPPNTGTQTNPLLITYDGGTLDFSAASGFDIPLGVNTAVGGQAPAQGTALAALTVDGAPGLYSIELTSGAATLLGALGAAPIQGMTTWDLPTPAARLSADGAQLVRFSLGNPGSTTAPVTISGVSAGEVLAGIDGRPATGQLYALGVNASADTASIYRLDPLTGAATVVGTPSAITYKDVLSNTVDLPPVELGYGFDFNPVVDRIRVVTGSGLNLRIHPDTGLPVDGNYGGTAVANTNPDGAINGAAAGVHATAYTNSWGGTTTTTQYTLDAAGNQLLLQSPPNNGTQTMPLALTLNDATLDFSEVNGFDIPPGAGVATSNTAATGNAYGALNVGGSVGLYRIDLASGATALQGTIGDGSVGVGGLVTWVDQPSATIGETGVVTEGAGLARLTVTSTGGSPLILGYAIAPGSAASGADYAPVTGTLALRGAGSTRSGEIAIPIVDDDLPEAGETLQVTIYGPQGIATTRTITIAASDWPTVQLDSATYAAAEGLQAQLTVTLSMTSTQPVTVSYQTTPGSALAGSDYAPISGTLVFAPGEQSKTLVVSLAKDDRAEPDESFTLVLGPVEGGELGAPSSATVTILDNTFRVYLPLVRKG